MHLEHIDMLQYAIHTFNVKSEPQHTKYKLHLVVASEVEVQHTKYTLYCGVATDIYSIDPCLPAGCCIGSFPWTDPDDH